MVIKRSMLWEIPSIIDIKEMLENSADIIPYILECYSKNLLSSSILNF